MNKLVLSGVVANIAPIRHTPAGLPLLSFVIQHASENIEAGMKRKVMCEVNAVAIGDLADLFKKQHIATGDNINATGFLAQRSAKSSQLVLHIQQITIIKD